VLGEFARDTEDFVSISVIGKVMNILLDS